MDKTIFILSLLSFAVTESQRWTGFGRCPPPRGPGVCMSSCDPNRFYGGCRRGQQCCRNGCGAFTCTRTSGHVEPPSTGVPPWCPPGSPLIRCFLNPCNLGCPRFPWARCRPTNPCEPACTGVFYSRGRRIPSWLCNSRQPRRG